MEEAERDWAPIRDDFENRTDRVIDVAERHSVARSTLMARANKEGWFRPRNSMAPDRSKIIVRMFRLLERQVIDLEVEMKELNEAKRRSGEKEITILGRLAGNLEKLIALDEKSGRGEVRASQTEAMEEVRAQLAERIALLKQG